MSDAAKPLPNVTDLNRPFWAGARDGKLLVQRCGACGRLRFPPARTCDACLSAAADWVPVSGQGTIWSVCEFHRSYLRGFATELPYNVALVTLDEGPRLYTNIVGLPYASIEIGMSVQAIFEPVTADAALVKFLPVQEASP